MTPEPAPTAPAAPAPRYRYFTVPPATVRLPVDDLTALLPEGAWIGSDADKRRELALPTAEILEKNFPRIRFSRLSDLLPGCIRSVDGAPEWIVLPTDRVALAYQPDTRREVIAEGEKPAAEPVAPLPPAAEDPEIVRLREQAIPGWKRLLKPKLAPPPAATASPDGGPATPDDATPAVASPPPEAVAVVVEPPAPPAAPIPLAEKRIAAEAEARLQQAFMTEDALSVARLIELGGALPSLQGIVLTRGAETVHSNPHLPPVDASTLTADVAGLLTKIGSGPGLRFKPAVTLYAESGPVSLLVHGDLRLVVLHRERAFLPGVREKLEASLEAIAAAF